MKPIIKAVIPVRSGSLRVKNKNLKPFAGSSLLELKIMQLLKTPGLDGVCVNSNDPEMLKVAEQLGAETCLRDQMFATNEIPMSAVYANIAENLICDVVLFVHATNPLADEVTYSNAISCYHGLDEQYDSVTTVSDVKDFLYWNGKALNYDPANKPRSQDLPDIVKLNHVASVLPRQTIIERCDILGHAPYFLKLDDSESTDIDTDLDFQIAEYLYQTKQAMKSSP